MFKFRTAFSRSVIRSTVSALLLGVLVPVATVVVIPQAVPAAASGAATCDTITRFDSATALNCWQKPYLASNGNLIVDPDGDLSASNNDQEVIGDSATGSAAYEYFSQGTGVGKFFFFRLRVKGDPVSAGVLGNSQSWSLGVGTGSTTHAWIFVARNGTTSGVYIDDPLVANGGGSDYNTAYAATSTDRGAADETVWVPSTLAVSGNSSLGYWIYFKVPVNDLPSAARTGSVGVAGGTATGGGGFNKDCINTLLTSGCSGSVSYNLLQSTNLSLSSTALPDIYLNKSGGETGTALSQTVLKNARVETVTVTNNGGAADSFTISANLPSGMTFETTTGRIYGAPSVTQSATTYTITANSANGTDTATYTLTVNEPAPSFTIGVAGGPSPCTSPCVDSGILNQLLDTVTVTPGASSGQIDSYTVSPALPAGLSINASTGQISGTPTETKTQTNYTITAYGPGGTSTVTYTLTVTASAVPANIVFTGSGETRSVSVRIGEALPTYTITNSGGHVDSYTISPTLTSPLQFNSSTGVISGTPTTMETNTVYTITANSVGGNDTLTYTLTVQQQQFTITVNQPTGGTISLSPAGGTYDSGTIVTASISLSGGYTDGTWSGACGGTTATSCSITVDSAKTVGASLTAPASGGSPAPAPTSFFLTVTATGQGTVSPASGSYPAGALAILATSPRNGWKFSNWTGACSGTTATCAVTMNSDKTVGAVFTEEVVAAGSTVATKFPISVSVTGLGIVQVSPGQPALGYDKDSLVKLTAAPRTGWALEVWGGACSGSSEFCILTMDAAKTVTAKFKATAVPEVVNAAWVQPQADGTSIVSWEAASGAVQYIVELNGRQACASAQTSCSIERMLGPRDIVVVIASNAAGKAEMSPLATFVAPTRALQLFTVNFNPGTATLTTRARATLTAAINRIKALGYTEMTLYGHTDNRESGASALSLARANAVATFVGRSVDVTFTTIGRAATAPLTSNSTIQGRAANRRVVGWVK